MNFILVFLGGGLGAAARHGISMLALRILGAGFPFGTLLVNVAGCLAMGLLVEYFSMKSGISMSARLFLTTGVLGGFTTFSAFSLELMVLVERGQAAQAFVYAAVSVLAGLSALYLGLIAMRVAG